MEFSHRNCTAILPASTKRRKDDRVPQWYREQTHGCWCSAWKLDEDGQWWIWRDEQWRKPRKGEMTEAHRDKEGE